jgi:hypothetical protein
LWYDKAYNPHGEDRMNRDQRQELASLEKAGAAKGIEIRVHERIDATADDSSRAVAKSGAIVIFGVHTSRDQTTKEFIGVATSTGTLGRSGIVNTDEKGQYVATPRAPTQADLVVVMACDSSHVRDAFMGANNFIGVNGGANHESSTFGLNQGIIETVRALVNANGNINDETLNTIVTNTQNVIRKNPLQGNPDPDDTVIRNPAIRVPTSGRIF